MKIEPTMKRAALILALVLAASAARAEPPYCGDPTAQRIGNWCFGKMLEITTDDGPVGYYMRLNFLTIVCKSEAYAMQLVVCDSESCALPAEGGRADVHIDADQKHVDIQGFVGSYDIDAPLTPSEVKVIASATQHLSYVVSGDGIRKNYTQDLSTGAAEAFAMLQHFCAK
jgi:hypothetical protein